MSDQGTLTHATIIIVLSKSFCYLEINLKSGFVSLMFLSLECNIFTHCSQGDYVLFPKLKSYVQKAYYLYLYTVLKMASSNNYEKIVYLRNIATCTCMYQGRSSGVQTCGDQRMEGRSGVPPQEK